MALGFGFNKAKVLATAEKFVQQGKFTNAITEYEKIIRHDAKDLTVLNTVGDLHARLGKTEQAVECFKRVGEAYASDGFTVKAIAMFKKVTKLSPGTPECMQKLADLYIQQGLYNDARSQFVHLAEHYLRAGDNEQASKIFQKMLDMDPDNSAMQAKLADLYVKMGRTEDARSIFFNAAESQLKRKSLEAADQALERVLKIDPNHAPSLLMRGKINSELGRHEIAIAYLEKLPNLDSEPDALRALMKSFLATSNLAEATPIAVKLIAVHNDLTGIAACGDAMMSAGEFESALNLFDQYADRLLAADAAGMLETLHSCVHRLRNNINALEKLQVIYRKAGDTSHVNEVIEALAEAQVQAGELAKARDLYHHLAEAEPENPLHAQNYRQILARLGEVEEESNLRPLPADAGEQTFMVDELEISAPTLEPGYPIEIAELVKSAMTDSELLDSYNLPSKAIKPLESVLPKAPQDPMLNQRLASLYARAERYSEAAKCCDTLRDIYWKAGYSEPAVRYKEMATKYRERAGEPEPQAEVPVVAQPAAEAPERSFPSEDAFAAGSAEMDLSHEWDSMAAKHAEGSAEEGTSQFISSERAFAGHLSAVSDLLEEVRFYIAQGMRAEAQAGIEKCAALAPDLPELAELRQQLESATAPAAEADPDSESHPDVDVAGDSGLDLDFDVEVESAPSSPVAEHEAPATEEVVEEAAATAPVPFAAPEVAPQFAETPAFQAAQKQDFPADHALNDLVLDLEESLGADFDFQGKQPPAPTASVPTEHVEASPVMQASVTPASPVEPQLAAPAPSSPAPDRQIEPTMSALSDVFEAFKEEVEHENAADSDDPEAHYNLGIAFREMGLLDEAIGELQKVCQSIERGHKFSRPIETYTWLAQCFIDKGAPQAAVKWYMRALKDPEINPDASLAVHYEMAMAYEAAGNTSAALDHYMEVYGTNIDYREVSERIKSLQAVVKST